MTKQGRYVQMLVDPTEKKAHSERQPFHKNSVYFRKAVSASGLRQYLAQSLQSKRKKPLRLSSG